MNRVSIISYLKEAYKLESLWQKQNFLLQELYNERSNILNQRPIAKKNYNNTKVQFYRRSPDLGSIITLFCIGGIAGLCLGGILAGAFNIHIQILLGILGGAIGIFLYIIPFEKENNSRLNSRNRRIAELKSENRLIEKENQIIEKNNQRRAEYNRQAIVEIDYEIKRVKKEQEKTKKIIDAFYSDGIIYYKYRGLIPISSLLEYFESGRVDSLKEAYNKYDNELLHRVIIDQLNICISQLNNIQNNQLALYQAIIEALDEVKEISGEYRTLAKGYKDLNQNIKMNNYHQQVNKIHMRTIENYQLLNLLKK